MAKTSMNIRMDNEIKQQAKKLFAEFGLDMTTAVNLFLRQSIREHRIPFEIRLETPNPETLAAMKEAEELLSDPKTKRFSSKEELFEELNR
ncbi:type II toxin-antitoxin system RelB/DinJ family antitoxin [Acetobacterium wieringae]|uniref:type II toxin-antitoxin system RelB/DinJ family antitoxin n=1 Tax=Acetobacterium wieringae TaxID=52694 RepID=UPI002B2124E1|nr:type II toxin-antitoxin system RelB/DinJ family antitoxin [Acetobacterium wieringae]MEA4805518.1 type II toxin-antitoxin system RelB/DinJ family antitoxin [Acetobacterium wieringae]